MSTTKLFKNEDGLFLIVGNSFVITTDGKQTDKNTVDSEYLIRGIKADGEWEEVI